MNVKRFLFMLVAAAWLAGAPAAADAATKELGKFKHWNAYIFEGDGSTVCFISSSPVKDEGKYTRRGKILALVAYHPAKGQKDVVSIEAGYPYKEGSTVDLSIDGQSFDLFTNGERAWAYTAEDDRAMVRAMKAGADMVVKGTSSRGTQTTDTYSLIGFTAAYNAMAKACPD